MNQVSISNYSQGYEYIQESMKKLQGIKTLKKSYGPNTSWFYFSTIVPVSSFIMSTRETFAITQDSFKALSSSIMSNNLS